MRITLSADDPIRSGADFLAVGVGSKNVARDPMVKKLDQAMGGSLLSHLKDEGFKGKLGQSLTMLGRGRLEARKLLLLGLGDEPKAATTQRLFAVRAARAAMGRPALSLVATGADPETLSLLAQGAVLGAYRYTRYLTGSRVPATPLKRVVIHVSKAPGRPERSAVSAATALGECVNLARDLINCPANDLTATELGRIASEQAKQAGVRCKVYDKKGIEKLGMPLLMAVNRGSSEEPRFIHMTHKPATRGAPRVVFVGKGLTFDSGGLCLKPADAMLDMKMDMGGAATTIGIVLAAARLKLPIEVHGVVASTDNMNGPDAYRPGDVFPSRKGKTVEIINTDAEGRLVLADALAYACELKPDYLIDHATLTGACLVALGKYRAGLFCNDEAMGRAYEKAAARSGEQFWQLPLDGDLRDQLKSRIADLKHTGTRYGGTITAALFLKEFVGDCRWAHLDIAGPAFLEKNHGIHPKGGTGFGILTAVEFLRSLLA
ncbi:MAG: leucyl aminopeptidase [Myxococcales bacterium]|nr:leucyl aminopeptidase [Myxococcales bacterium]